MSNTAEHISPKAWTLWTKTELHDVTRCQIWSFIKDSYSDGMINVSRKTPRSIFWEHRMHVLVEKPKPLSMKPQTKQLWLNIKKLNPGTNSGPPQLKSDSSSFLFIIWHLTLVAWSQIFIGAWYSKRITDTFLNLMMFFSMSVQIE